MPTPKLTKLQLEIIAAGVYAERASVCLRRVVKATVVIPVAVLQIACSSKAIVFAGGPANCVNLGDLTVLASTRRDAEQLMLQRVSELRGDTLVFDERSRSERLDDLPEEIIERREELLAPVEANDSQVVAAAPPPEVAPDIAEDTHELARPPNGSQSRAPRITWEELPSIEGARWYYGAALRCNSIE